MGTIHHITATPLNLDVLLNSDLSILQIHSCLQNAMAQLQFVRGVGEQMASVMQGQVQQLAGAIDSMHDMLEEYYALSGLHPRPADDGSSAPGEAHVDQGMHTPGRSKSMQDPMSVAMSPGLLQQQLALVGAMRQGQLSSSMWKINVFWSLL